MIENNSPSKDNEQKDSSSEYLRRAIEADATGDRLLALHLYLAAYEKSTTASDSPDENAIMCLKKAWTLACTEKERSIAEYIFEKLEPYLSSDEIAECAERLQTLALDKLEEFGLSREDLEDMTEMISQDFLGLDAHVIKVESIIDTPVTPHDAKPSAAQIMIESSKEDPSEVDANAVPKNAEKPKQDASTSQGTNVPDAPKPKAMAVASSKSKQGRSGKDPIALFAEAIGSDMRTGAPDVPLNYDLLAGYSTVINTMREFGVGMKDDPEFQKLVHLLNVRHGLGRMPAADSMLFRAPAREDANRFIDATLGELKLPTLRMNMEENMQGMPILCVTAQASDAPRMNSLRNALENGGVLVLEDLDLWSSPIMENMEELPNFFMAQLTRGAREAINIMRAAVENPDVYVLATASSTGEIDPFFLDLLEPVSFIDIDYPTPEERIEIWMDITHEHPSMRGIRMEELVRLSANMPRYDIYMAANEAIEEAYKVSLMTRRYQPVTRENIFDKLAAYQPLDSDEYKELEEAVIQDFRSDLDHLEDLLGNR